MHDWSSLCHLVRAPAVFKTGPPGFHKMAQRAPNMHVEACEAPAEPFENPLNKIGKPIRPLSTKTLTSLPPLLLNPLLSVPLLPLPSALVARQKSHGPKKKNSGEEKKEPPHHPRPLTPKFHKMSSEPSD